MFSCTSRFKILWLLCSELFMWTAFCMIRMEVTNSAADPFSMMKKLCILTEQFVPWEFQSLASVAEFFSSGRSDNLFKTYDVFASWFATSCFALPKYHEIAGSTCTYSQTPPLAPHKAITLWVRRSRPRIATSITSPRNSRHPRCRLLTTIDSKWRSGCRPGLHPAFWESYPDQSRLEALFIYLSWPQYDPGFF